MEFMDKETCPVVKSNGNGNYKLNHQMVIREGEGRVAKKDMELLMALRFIIYGSPGCMLTEAKMFLHTRKNTDGSDSFLNEKPL